jgi:hypothetical protein
MSGETVSLSSVTQRCGPTITIALVPGPIDLAGISGGTDL